ncbi:hypothetical protein VTK73DRAFT_3659 [Phialemonium thermophilum]|uniref:Uncharacterized protein n=1 Tax=Phialemonium thermophilum TaxID=223376 RepID=A0ABR3VGB4_9PEZI
MDFHCRLGSLMDRACMSWELFLLTILRRASADLRWDTGPDGLRSHSATFYRPCRLQDLLATSHISPGGSAMDPRFPHPPPPPPPPPQEEDEKPLLQRESPVRQSAGSDSDSSNRRMRGTG